jgi:5-(carboxyamino)imidazole ribonucleotide mutase
MGVLAIRTGPRIPGSARLPPSRVTIAPRKGALFRNPTRPLRAPTIQNDMTRESPEAPLVGVVMGSKSDWDTMRHCSELLTELGIPHESKVVSAHRTPDRLFRYGREAEGRGLEVVIAGAGGAAHLPGMLAAITLLPVLGVPVESKTLRGVDSLLSIVQMPRGVPVGTLAIGASGAANAAILAAAILGQKYPEIREALARFRQAQTDAVGELPV